MWIETANDRAFGADIESHTPRGVCGLKPDKKTAHEFVAWSHPAWGVWIETGQASVVGGAEQSHPAWGVWIETKHN